MDSTLRISRRDGGELVVDAYPIARRFFGFDPSSVGERSFDANAGRTSPYRIELSDIQILNRTVTARSSHGLWTLLIDRDHEWLRDLDPGLDLIEADDREWQSARGEALMEAALGATLGHRRGLAVTTKLLHLKRPRLFPLLDSLVGEMVGFNGPQSRSPEVRQRYAMQMICHLRAEGRANIEPLRSVQSELAADGIDRPLIRILDAVLWSTHPAANPGLTRRITTSALA